jgi:hypothetical protein
MNVDPLRHAVIGLLNVVRQQHSQLELLRRSLMAVRSAFGPEAEKKIDAQLRENLRMYGPLSEYKDETLDLIQRLSEQLHKMNVS